MFNAQVDDMSNVTPGLDLRGFSAEQDRDEGVDPIKDHLCNTKPATTRGNRDDDLIMSRILKVSQCLLKRRPHRRNL